MNKIELIKEKTGESVVIDMPKRIAINNVLLNQQILHSNEMIVGLHDTGMLEAEWLIRVLPDYRQYTMSYYLLKHPYENNPLTNLFCSFIEGVLFKHRNL